MGLDARVYCDCFERGRLASQPNPEWGVFVAPEGGRCERTGLPLEVAVEFDRWNDGACQHKEGILIEQRIGNMWGVIELRQELERESAAFPLLLAKVLYSGTHGGDWMNVQEVELMRHELEPLAHLHSSEPSTEAYLREFEHIMRELTEAALRVQKPIVF